MVFYITYRNSSIAKEGSAEEEEDEVSTRSLPSKPATKRKSYVCRKMKLYAPKQQETIEISHYQFM